MIESVVVIAIIAGVAWLTFRSFAKTYRGESSGCSCGISCPAAKGCSAGDADERCPSLETSLSNRGGEAFHGAYAHCAAGYSDRLQMASSFGVRPLNQVCGGRRATIVEFIGGRRLQGRLSDMGLRVGSEVDVLSGESGKDCAVRVAVGETHLALGRGASDKILVHVN